MSAPSSQVVSASQTKKRLAAGRVFDVGVPVVFGPVVVARVPVENDVVAEVDWVDEFQHGRVAVGVVETAFAGQIEHHVEAVGLSADSAAVVGGEPVVLVAAEVARRRRRRPGVR